MISQENQFTRRVQAITFALNDGKKYAKINKMYIPSIQGNKLTPEEYFEQYLKPRFTDKVDTGTFLKDIVYTLTKGKKLYQEDHHE